MHVNFKRNKKMHFVFGKQMLLKKKNSWMRFDAMLFQRFLFSHFSNEKKKIISTDFIEFFFCFEQTNNYDLNWNCRKINLLQIAK